MTLICEWSFNVVATLYSWNFKKLNKHTDSSTEYSGGTCTQRTRENHSQRTL